MGFCGECGKKSNIADKFCTACGTVIIEATVSVLENTREVIKEEHRSNTASFDAVDISSGTHIGDQKKSGEWLEYTIEHILKYAGFQTKREVPFVFNDGTGDQFKIDVLASDANIEIFVECKDHMQLKMSEKIMYTLTGQLDDYRKRQPKSVIGILAMSAKDDGRNLGISDSLKKHNSFLWDGSFIEHIKNKMIELGNRDDFRRYLLDHLDIFEAPKTKSVGNYEFLIKYSFFTISPDQYVGKSFDITNFINDVNEQLDNSGIKIINRKFEPVKHDNRILSYKIFVDFSLQLSNNEIIKYSKKHKKLSDKLRRRDDLDIIYHNYKNTIEVSLGNVYGIRYNPKSNNIHDRITFEGYRIK